MVIIGLTGGIASGKSTVTQYLRERGAPVVDADAIVHELQSPGTPVLAAIAGEFGPGVIRPDGSLDRAALGRIVFADPGRRQELEAIVHPAVRERMWTEVEQQRRHGAPAVVLDVPLLIEGGTHKLVDRVWLVYVDREIQRTRLVVRDGLTLDEAEQRLSAQMPIDEKVPLADEVIDNRGSRETTRRQVLELWQRVTSE